MSRRQPEWPRSEGPKDIASTGQPRTALYELYLGSLAGGGGHKETRGDGNCVVTVFEAPPPRQSQTVPQAHLSTHHLQAVSESRHRRASGEEWRPGDSAGFCLLPLLAPSLTRLQSHVFQQQPFSVPHWSQCPRSPRLPVPVASSVEQSGELTDDLDVKSHALHRGCRRLASSRKVRHPPETGAVGSGACPP